MCVDREMRKRWVRTAATVRLHEATSMQLSVRRETMIRNSPAPKTMTTPSRLNPSPADSGVPSIDRQLDKFLPREQRSEGSCYTYC
jgi:hypothetical protein